MIKTIIIESVTIVFQTFQIFQQGIFAYICSHQLQLKQKAVHFCVCSLQWMKSYILIALCVFVCVCLCVCGRTKSHSS